MIPKSLHTVTTLVNVARFLRDQQPNVSVESAAYRALEIVGYDAGTDDPHHIIFMVCKKLNKG